MIFLQYRIIHSELTAETQRAAEKNSKYLFSAFSVPSAVNLFPFPGARGCR